MIPVLVVFNHDSDLDLSGIPAYCVSELGENFPTTFLIDVLEIKFIICTIKLDSFSIFPITVNGPTFDFSLTVRDILGSGALYVSCHQCCHVLQ